MTDTPPSPPVPQPAQAAPEAPKPQEPAAPESTEIDWKAKSREWEKRAKENSTAAARLAELEEAQKTEAQKLSERAEVAEKELAAARHDSLRSRVAISKGVPADLVDRLRGDTEADLAEDADRLLALLQPGKPRGDVAQGPRGNGEPTGDPASDFARIISGQLAR